MNIVLRRDVFRIILRGSEEQILVCNFVNFLTQKELKISAMLQLSVTSSPFSFN